MPKVKPLETREKTPTKLEGSSKNLQKQVTENALSKTYRANRKGQTAETPLR